MGFKRKTPNNILLHLDVRYIPIRLFQGKVEELLQG